MKTKIITLIFSVFITLSSFAQEEYIGTIKMFAGNFAPRGYLFCDGRLLPISQYTALFSILGTMYGGNGVTTFALPDLRGRVPIQAGAGPELSNYALGQSGGEERTSLTIANLPQHMHGITALGVELEGNSHLPTDAYPANTYETTPINGDQPCSGLGTCEFRIAWNTSQNRESKRGYWCIRGSNG